METTVFFEFGHQQIRVNVPSQDALKAEIQQRFRDAQGFALATVNLDHLVKMGQSPAFVDTYSRQDLIVADGRPIVWLSALAGTRVDLLPGSDLVKPLCSWAADSGVPVALVGSTDAALADAARVLATHIKGLKISMCVAPSGNFDPNGDEAETILAQLNDSNIGLCLLALGAPKQETLAQRGRDLAPAVGFASIGAGLDFLGGHQQRAPVWVRRIAMEWLWRLLSDPRRLTGRYLSSFAILPGQAVVALRRRFTAR